MSKNTDKIQVYLQIKNRRYKNNGDTITSSYSETTVEGEKNERICEIHNVYFDYFYISGL